MIGGFRHNGLAELYQTGQSRRIGADYARKCILILELLDKATRPEHMNIIWIEVPWPARQATPLARPAQRQLPHHVRLVRRGCCRCRF